MTSPPVLRSSFLLVFVARSLALLFFARRGTTGTDSHLSVSSLSTAWDLLSAANSLQYSTGCAKTSSCHNGDDMRQGIALCAAAAIKNSQTNILAPARPTAFKQTVQKKYASPLDAATRLHRVERGSREPFNDSPTMKKAGEIMLARTLFFFASMNGFLHHLSIIKPSSLLFFCIPHFIPPETHRR